MFNTPASRPGRGSHLHGLDVRLGTPLGNLVVNSTIVSVSNSTGTANLIPGQLVIGTSVVNSTGFAPGANVFLSTASLFIGNSTANLFANSILFKVANSTGIANLSPTTLVIGTSTINATSLVAGANAFLDTVKLSVGNTTANIIANSIIYQVSNATGVSNLTPTSLQVAANVTLDTVKLSVGNSVANLIANSIIVSVANSTGTANLQPTQLVIGTSVVGLSSFAPGANITLDTVRLLVGNSTANLLANSIMVSIANSTGTANLQPTQLVIGSSTVNTTAYVAGANVFLSTTALSIGNTTVNTFVNSSYISTTGNIACQDIAVSGNLTIAGTLSTINTVNLVVHDPLIKLAKDNAADDLIDIGFYGLCDPTSSQDTFTGLFRDASDAKYKLFDLLQTEPTTTVNLGAAGYNQATLVCALESNNVNITGGTIDCGTY